MSESMIDEQYQAAAKQRRDLDRPTRPANDPAALRALEAKVAEKLGIKPTGFRCEREDGRFEIVDSLERAGFLRGKWEEQDPENENVWISDEYPWFSEPGVRNFDLVIEALADRAASINYDPDGLGAGVVTITDSAGRQSVAQGPVKMRRIAVLEAVAAMEE